MKKILLSLGIIAAVAAVAVGATVAVLSDQKSIAGNSVAIGTLKISINKTAGKPWAVSNMKPGDITNWEWMDVINVGSLPATYYFYVDNKNGTPDMNLWNNLKIELRNAGTGATDIERCNNGTVIHNDYVQNVDGMSNKINTTDFAYGPGSQMPAGWSQRICQRVYLDLGVGNEVMGRTTTFDEVMYAEQ